MPHPDTTIEVRDFGPLTHAAIDLRPLTVFVGPSNAGKTYLATLISALHRACDGFPRIPPRGLFITERIPAVQGATERPKRGELKCARYRGSSRSFRDRRPNTRHADQDRR